MTEQQKRAIKIALNFCRADLKINTHGALDYDDLAKQIALLSNAAHIKSLVAWVLEYERFEEHV